MFANTLRAKANGWKPRRQFPPAIIIWKGAASRYCSPRAPVPCCAPPWPRSLPN